MPDFNYEEKLWCRGFKFVAGADEVGRGCFAGPVVAGCVIFPQGLKIQQNVRIDDSKKLTAKQREEAAEWIKKNALSWATGEASAGLINSIGMGKATKVAFRKAISQVLKNTKLDFLLIDAFYIPWVKGLRRKNQKAIIDGDEKSFSIAAASIVAKVYRDELMRSLSKKRKLRKYGWDKNKGYGTLVHRRAIKRWGITRFHRRVFVSTFLNRSSSSQSQLSA